MLRNGRICNIEFINGLFDHGLLLGLGDDDHPQYGEIAQTESVSGLWTFNAFGDGGRTNYDIKIGDTDGTPTYGMIQFGDAVIGRTSYKAGNIDLDGSVLIQNIGGPVTSQVEFCFAVSTGSSTRFALAKAGVGNATYNSRSMLIAGPAPANTDFVTVGYWQTNNNIFDNLVCDTDGSGADLGVQNDLEVEGDIFCDSFKESTTDADITFADTVIAPTFNATDEINAFQIDGTTQFATKSPVDVDGIANLFIGENAGISNTEGDRNVFIGDSAGKENTTGIVNICIGEEAGRDATTGDGNVFIGRRAGAGISSTNTGEFNVGLGVQSCGWNNLSTGADNMCIGSQAGGDLSTGKRNVCIGRNAGRLLTTSSDNMFLGKEAGRAGGSQNVYFGTETGENSTSSKNVGGGYQCIQLQTSGEKNVIFGWRGSYFNQTGSNNAIMGFEAFLGVTGNSHSNNTGIGNESGHHITTGSSNVFLGNDAGHNQTTNSDLLIIDNQERSSAGNEAIQSLIYGTFNATVASQILAVNAGTVTLNAGVDTDLVLNFTGTTNSGILTWMEDEDYFKFSDDVAFADAEYLIFDKASGNGIKIDTTTPTFGFADLLGDQFSKNTGATKPTLATYNGAIDAWQFSDGDEGFFSFHIPHDYVLGTDIHLHIHWSQTSATATGGTIDFKYFAIYAKGHNQASGSTFTSTPITASFSSIDINDGSSGLSQYQQHLTEVTISAATATAALFDRDDFEPDGVIELTLEMDTNSLTNSVTVLDPFIHYVDIHYQTTGIIGTKSRTPDFYA